jgi:hypothetical protein
MKSLWRGWLLVAVALAAGLGTVHAQSLATTTVEDTVYRADGTAAGGSVVISWGSFTTANGVAVPAGSTAATIGTGGALDVALAPNAGATPMGSYYTVIFHLNDGTISKEYWVVPVTVAGGGPVKLASIRNQVLPTSVAMQTVSKQYVDNAIAQAQLGPLDESPYVLKSGDTMTGPLSLPGDPATATQAADKNYVDTNVASVASGLNGKVALLPSASQLINQPSGTQLQTTRLNGQIYASPLYDVATGVTAQTILAGPDCASGCKLVLDQTYPGIGVSLNGLVPRSRVVNERRGNSAVSSQDPAGMGDIVPATSYDDVTTRSQTDFAANGNGGSLAGVTMTMTQRAYAGGNNQYPAGIESVPYFKNTYSVLQLDGEYYTEGQHISLGKTVHCYGVGDCLSGANFLYSSGGYRDPSDEGSHPEDLVTAEDPAYYAGTCSSGCSPGSTNVTVTAITGGGAPGEGRFLLDKNPADTIANGSLVSGSLSGPYGVVNFTGTSFPISVLLETASAATSQPHNMAPGTVTLPIVTSGVPSGYSTNTAALHANTGVACVVDRPAGARDPNYETANYTVIDGSHVQVTLYKVHASGATISVGGLCGYGVEQTVDTQAGQRQVFPIVGSTSATSLLVADGNATLLGDTGDRTTSGFANISQSIASIVRSGNVVTVTTAASFAQDPNGLTLTISGVSDPSFNGSFAIASTSPNTFTYANTGADGTSTGGTATYLTGGFVIYPMAEVRGVYDAATHSVDGVLTLAPNAVPWTTGDAVEEPHFYLIKVYPDAEQIEQTLPRPWRDNIAPGKIYAGNMGPGIVGWEIRNAVPVASYYGAGGTHQPPVSAFVSSGVWRQNMSMTAGTDGVFSITCNLHGCNRYDSGYNLFTLQGSTGTDALTYAPNTRTATWSMDGAQYSFGASGFTAPTINVGTLNATTITGGFVGNSITSGTISPARLPIFGASGTTHAAGVVPDPGAVAGATRFLREDGTWTVPAGSSGTGGGSSAFLLTANGVAGTPGLWAEGMPYAGGTGTTTVPYFLVGSQLSSSWGTLGTYFGISAPSAFSGNLLDFKKNGASVLQVGNNGEIYTPTGMANSNASSAVLFGSSGSIIEAIGATGSTPALMVTSGSPSNTGDLADFSNSGGIVAKVLHSGVVVTPGVGSGTSSNTDLVGTLTLAAGSISSASYAFAGTYASAPVCMVQPQSATPSTVSGLTGISAQVTVTSLSVSVGTAPGSAVTFGYICAARN